MFGLKSAEVITEVVFLPVKTSRNILAFINTFLVPA